MQPCLSPLIVRMRNKGSLDSLAEAALPHARIRVWRRGRGRAGRGRLLGPRHLGPWPRRGGRRGRARTETGNCKITPYLNLD